ncbi:MAG: trypsin-like peptidase domain-containing protein [Candidatus Gastranaerophilaceae bacterium]
MLGLIKKSPVIFIVIFAFFQAQVVQAQVYDADEQININVYEKITPTIVTIDAQLEDGISSGTGCIVTSDGVILTSSHVIDGAKDIDVTIHSGKVYKANVLSILGKNNDLALIKIKTEKPLATIKLGDSERVKVGQKVLAIGNPFGFSETLTEGIVSRIDYTKNKIQTDAAINPGNSGGPLLNSSGEVIGISQSIYNPDNNKSNIGIGFAVPVNSVKEFIDLAKISKKF